MLKNLNKTGLFVLATLFFFSCNRSDYPEFETREFNKTEGDCEHGSCLDIHLKYHVIKEGYSAAQPYNKLIEQRIFSKMGSENEIRTKEKYIERLLKDFEAFQKEFPDAASGGFQQHSQTEITYKGKDVLSILLISNIYAGGAHAMNYEEFININPITGNELNLSDLIKNKKDFNKMVESKLRVELKMSPYDRWSDFTLVDQFVMPENMGFTGDGEMMLVYNEYEILPYSDGPVKLTITKEELAPFLKKPL
jgi:hypothetical protein